MPVERRRDGAHGPSDRGHHDLRNGKIERPLHAQGGRSPSYRIGSEIVTVPDEPRHTEEERPRTRLITAVAECADVDIGTRQAPALDTREEVR